ncbi:anthranilate synthase component I [Dankookia rubra]
MRRMGMQVWPERDAFLDAYEAGRSQVVWTRLVADLDTPVAAMMKLAEGARHGFLLESVEGGSARGRFSYIGLRPDLIWRCQGLRAEVNRAVRLGEEHWEVSPLPALASLRALVEESRIALPPGLPPGSASLIGFFAYDFARLIERLPAMNPDELGLPDAMLMRPTVIAVFDNVLDQVTVVTPVYPEPRLSAGAAYDRARERLADVVTDFGRSLPRMPVPARPAPPIRPVSNLTREQYRGIVERAKAYIAAGDAFQVVPSQRFSMPFQLSPLALYRALRRLNPSPFSFCLNLGDFALVGSSPEILVRVRDGAVTVRPIAGTRRRGATVEEDHALERSLLEDPKELAEHLMLLDLGRNDVGRVARVGTVRVTERMVVERYSHVMHIVSNVEGQLDPARADALDAFCAGFPAGTVSGAPKIRAMEIIEELEPTRRGFYAGAVGYLGADGNVDTCIGLRTGLVKDGMLHVQAGGGVVADSDPDAEYEESCNKAQAVLAAAAEAVRFAEGGYSAMPDLAEVAR